MNKFILLVFPLIVVSCAIKSKVRDDAQMKDLKKVAVIGFNASIPAGIAGGSIEKITSAETDKMFAEFNKALVKQFNWQVLDADTMKRQPAYVRAYDMTMKGWQNKSMVDPNRRNFVIEGIMDTESLRQMGKEGRDQLMQALRVDSLIVATVGTYFESFTVMGIGNRYPQARVYVQMYKKGAEDITWR